MTIKNETSQNLYEAFVRLRKINWINWSSNSQLKASDIRVLFCIYHEPQSDPQGMMVSQISSCLHVTSPTVTQLIKELEAKGLVERAMDESDRRVIRVRLTADGIDVVTKAQEVVSEAFHGLTEYLGEQDSEQLAVLLSKVFRYYTDGQLKQGGDDSTC